MPEYLSPGVYVEEIDAGPKPIEGVSTSTAGAIGVTARGPTSGKPVLVTSFLQFERTFGSYLPEPLPALLNSWALNDTEGGHWWKFPLSVKGFFDNGGQRLYVKRVFSSTAQTSSLILARGIIAEIIRDAKAGSTELRLRHTIGIANGTAVRVFVDGLAAGNFTVASYTSAGVVVLDAPVTHDLVSGRDFIEIIPRVATPAPPPDFRLTVRAKASGNWGGNEISEKGITAGNGLRVRVRPVVGAALKMMASPTAGGNTARGAVRADTAGTATIPVLSVDGFVTGDHVLIDDNEYTISNITAAQFDLDNPVPAGGFPAGTVVREGGQVRTTLTADVAAGQTVRVASLTDLDDGNTVEIGGNDYTISNRVAAGQFTISPPAVGVLAPGTNVEESATVRGTLTAETPDGGTTVRITNIADLANGNTVEIAGNDYTISGVTPTPVITLDNPVPTGDTWTAGTPIRRMRPVIDQAARNIINAENPSQLYTGAIVELDNGTNKESFTVDAVAGNTVTLSDDTTNDYFEDDRLRLIEAEVAVQYRRNHIIVEEEAFSNLRFVDDGGPNYIARHINEESELIDLAPGGDFAGSVSTLAEFPIIPEALPQRFWGDLTGGRDNLEGLTVDDFVGVEGGSEASTGIQSLEYIDEISICLAPGMWAASVQSALIQHCETLKDRFAILDPPGGLDIEEIREFREPIDTKYAALYYPWIEVRDPSVRRNVYLSPSGHMAGLYARVDVERGVHKAPANEVVRGITRKGLERDVSKREQDLLNPRGINALRFFPGRGNRVWGARTLSSDSSWKYINVRRLFIFVEESIDEGTQWVVFEPNDEPLWARVRQTITNFLTTVWRSGALEGTKADEAFFVKCDRSTMTQADIDNGKLICIIGIAPVKPAEFVIFRIQQKTRELTT